MGIRSKVVMLPATVRADLDRRIVERAFSGYRAVAEWIQAQGYHISDDSVQRYGVRLRRELAAIKLACEQVHAIAGAGDAPDAFAAITVQQIQQQVLSVLQQVSGPAEASNRGNTGEAACANSGDSRKTGEEFGEDCLPEPIHISAEPDESPVDPLQPISEPARPTSTRENPPEPTQPQLTAHGRIIRTKPSVAF